MKPNERNANANDCSTMPKQPQIESNKQGSEMSKYSRKKISVNQLDRLLLN